MSNSIGGMGGSIPAQNFTAPMLGSSAQNAAGGMGETNEMMSQMAAVTRQQGEMTLAQGRMQAMLKFMEGIAKTFKAGAEAVKNLC